MNESDVRQRLDELRREFEAGQRQLVELDAHRVELEQQLLRIGGAIQVLEELTGSTGSAEPQPQG